MNYFEEVKYLVENTPDGAEYVWKDNPHYIYINSLGECMWLGDSTWKDKCCFPEVDISSLRKILDLKVLMSQKYELESKEEKFTKKVLDYQVKSARSESFNEIFQNFSEKRLWNIADKMKHSWTITGIYMKCKYTKSNNLEHHLLLEGDIK